MSRRIPARPARPARSLARWVSAGLLAATLVGCSTMPDHGPVTRGPAIDANEVQGPRVRAQGPVSGARPEDIVRGFLAAGVDAEAGRATAREFLTGAALEEWTGEGPVVVHESTSELRYDLPEEGAVTVSMPVHAVLDSSGHLVESAGSARRTDTFGLEKVDGDWRISEIPQGVGLWMSAAEFERLYVKAGITYADPGHQVLVPDSRFFPRGPGLATALARAQVGRVPTSLLGAVVNGVPAGTRLQVESVPVNEGIARVELSPQALEADDEARRMMWAQFSQTLSQVPNVEAIELRAGGASLEVDGVGPVLGSAAPTGYRTEDGRIPYALLVRGADLVRVDPTDPDLQELEVAGDQTTPRLPARVFAVATTFGVDEFAWVNDQRSTLTRWRAGESADLSSLGTHLTAPSFDQWDGLWVAARADAGAAVWRFDTSGSLRSAPTRVEIPWNGGQDITVLRVSNDATRVLIVRRDPRTGVDQLGVSGIVRSRAGQVRSLTEPRVLSQVLTQVTDAVWVDDDTVAVLARRARSDELRPEIVELAGTTRQLDAVEHARSLASYPSARGEGLLVSTRQGRVLSRSGAGFVPAGSGTSVVVPGR